MSKRRRAYTYPIPCTPLPSSYEIAEVLYEDKGCYFSIRACDNCPAYAVCRWALRLDVTDKIFHRSVMNASEKYISPVEAKQVHQ